MKREFAYAMDESIKKRVVHVIEDGYATSLVTGTKFKIGD